MNNIIPDKQVGLEQKPFIGNGRSVTALWITFLTFRVFNLLLLIINVEHTVKLMNDCNVSCSILYFQRKMNFKFNVFYALPEISIILTTLPNYDKSYTSVGSICRIYNELSERKRTICVF